VAERDATEAWDVALCKKKCWLELADDWFKELLKPHGQAVAAKYYTLTLAHIMQALQLSHIGL